MTSMTLIFTEHFQLTSSLDFLMDFLIRLPLNHVNLPWLQFLEWTFLIDFFVGLFVGLFAKLLLIIFCLIIFTEIIGDNLFCLDAFYNDFGPRLHSLRLCGNSCGSSANLLSVWLLIYFFFTQSLLICCCCVSFKNCRCRFISVGRIFWCCWFTFEFVWAVRLSWRL